MSTYRGYRPRPVLAPLRDGVVDFAAATPEQMQALMEIMRGYPPPDVEGAAQQAFVGITTDGKPISGLFALQDTGLDPGPILAAAEELWSVLDEVQRGSISQPLDSTAWRLWTNAFPTWPPHGLRLQDLTDDKRQAVLEVIRASLSSQGYDQVRDVMRMNAELGKLVEAYPDTLTEWMYFFSIFGRPSREEPWGWQIHGHHLDLHCLIIGRQLVLTPAFLGAELESEKLFPQERSCALELVNGLSTEQRSDVVLYERFADLPHELQGPIDGRHLGGAGQDNRVIPYEGLPVGGLTSPQRSAFERLVDAWISRMPAGPAQAKIREIERHLDETHFAWFGPTDGAAAFYYRIHSPVVLIEYDNHPGVFLDNDEAEPFHVHTIVRTPNGNDYGRDILRQHLETHKH